MVNPYQSYIKTELDSLPVAGIIAKGYDRIILELKRAIENIEKGNIKGKIENISKALDLLTTLRLGLDFEKGGDIARNLEDIYSFCEREIQLANLKNDTERLKSVIKVLDTLKSGWEELAAKS
ncbi:flagellar protein FliS [Sulfurihydrogenibium azorense Az-Fu1]|jgi:flagellar protein FliS|uniref:Flagellar protein FliS n=1 Tax=Sulfurihydrogenibium azorense (strain DSM 15241 / OCM 825 / Az-Fu1) TaxID=204536 RepID=C1DVE6_SULAA|nr:flagellar export chaperone FliS [Sulfurihydrogenibium azorense]ACN99694.1 flagellar protein FliS [Sulfurihydrogenibium azorense Az-Fu1]